MFKSLIDNIWKEHINEIDKVSVQAYINKFGESPYIEGTKIIKPEAFKNMENHHIEFEGYKETMEYNENAITLTTSFDSVKIVHNSERKWNDEKASFMP